MKAHFKVEYAATGSGALFFFAKNELAELMIEKENGFSGGVGYRTAKECYPVCMPERFSQYDVFVSLQNSFSKE